MIEEPKARSLAEADLGETRDEIALGEARELSEGWFFPYLTEAIGCQGVIVSKRTGRLFHLGSRFPIERDLALYDRGWQFELYDLVVLSISDRDATRRTIGQLPIDVVEPEYAHGEVWRIPKPMRDKDRWKRLQKLPCVFPALSLYFVIDVLEEVREKGWFEFVALECRSS